MPTRETRLRQKIRDNTRRAGNDPDTGLPLDAKKAPPGKAAPSDPPKKPSELIIENEKIDDLEKKQEIYQETKSEVEEELEKIPKKKKAVKKKPAKKSEK